MPKLQASRIGPENNGGYAGNSNLFLWERSRSLPEIADAAGTFIISEAAQCDSAKVVNNTDPDSWPRYVQRRADYHVTPPGGWTGGYNYNRADDTNQNRSRRPIARHNGGLNVIYCDGHAKWSRVTQFLGIPNNGTGSAPSAEGWRYGHANNSWDDR